MENLLKEENSELKNKYWEPSEELLNHLTRIFNAYKGDKTNEGYSRLENLLQTKEISYQQMKRIKNFFDTFQGSINDTSYLLNGGSKMKTWVDECLGVARQDIKGKKKSMMYVGMDNQFQQDGGTKTQDTSAQRIKNNKVSSSSRHISDNRGIYEIKAFTNLLNVFTENNKKIKNI